jgi:hypothetical protein
MKNKVGFIAVTLVLLVASCSPSQDKANLPEPLSRDALKFSVTQKSGEDNVVYLQSQTNGVIPYWDFGSGTSTQVNDTVIFPFSGDYVIHYDASTGGGFVEGDSVTVHVTTTNLSYLTDPSWAYLTGGQNGKTWVLDMARPIGWYGYDYLKNNGSADDWSWHPDYAGNEWVMPDRYYGEMTFDLNNGKNYHRTYIDDQGNTENCSGKFDFNIASHTIKLIGCELLYGGDYHGQVTNWSNVTVLALSDTSMTLAVSRDHPNPGDGPCWIGFTYKVKTK